MDAFNPRDEIYTIEERQSFSKSMLWEFQRQFYQSNGVEAWREKHVPFYATSSAVFGRAYAEIVLGFLRDMAGCGKKIYLLELGAGHGRFTYMFLKYFVKAYNDSPIALPEFCYIQSDLVESNIGACENSCLFQPFIEAGLLDFCVFDVEESYALRLRRSGLELGAGSLDAPLIVVANYILDTIPQELFLIKNQKLHQSYVSVGSKDKDASPQDKDFWDKLLLKYEYGETSIPPHYSPRNQELLRSYINRGVDTCMLFPHVCIDCIRRLRDISPEGLMLMSTDKGSHYFSQEREPYPVTHNGCFSFSVNYGVLKSFCEMEGGYALFPSLPSDSLNTGCCFITQSKRRFFEAEVAFERYINVLGPCITYELNELIEISLQQPRCKSILNMLHINGYDPFIFTQVAPYIRLLTEITEAEKACLRDAVYRIWDLRYPATDGQDLAYELGALLYYLEFYSEAIDFLKLSPQANDKSVLQDILFCYYKTEDYSSAIRLLENIGYKGG